MKSFLVRPFANIIRRKIHRDSQNAVSDQHRIFRSIVGSAKNTVFGKDHDFGSIATYSQFKERVPIRDYEQLRPWIDRMVLGEPDILWPGKPAYLAKTSGTTSGIKYIPITKESIPNHFNTARNAVFCYSSITGNYKFFDGKMIFLSGSPELETTNGIPTGRLSGIANHMIPSYLKLSQVPSFETNCIEAWEKKVDTIVSETLGQNMTLISGIPPWVQMYFERLIEVSGKRSVREIFPNFDVFVFGGVNMEPYRKKLELLIGEHIPTIETYPASEGFIAFQDRPEHDGLLLNANSGIFFEFIPADEYFNDNPTRLNLEQVDTGVSYALILNSNAGLWGYSIGDTVEFLSTDPYKIRITGRIKHYISAFGEHVIGKEVDDAMLEVCEAMDVKINEFTVAPQVDPEFGLPHHEWFVEFDQVPAMLDEFSAQLDKSLRRQNIYYDDLVQGGILRPLVVRPMQRDAFRNYMKEEGKLGGQNKVPRLSNDRAIADRLSTYVMHDYTAEVVS